MTDSATLDSLADEDWRFQIDADQINEPTICYPDPGRRGCFVGPLATVFVGATEENEDGDEVLCVSGADGRNLAAIACLPHFAGMFRWMRQEMERLNPIHFDRQSDYGRFMRELRDRMNWIACCIDERDAESDGGFGPGMHGFQRFEGSSPCTK